MFIVFFLIEVVNSVLIQLVLLYLALLVLHKKDYLILCGLLVLSTVLSLSPILIKGNQFVVTKQHDSYTMFRQGLNQVIVWETYDGYVDDLVQIDGNLLDVENSSFNAVHRIHYQIEKPVIKKIKSKFSIKSSLSKSLKKYPLSQSLILNQQIDQLPMMSSLALQVSGILKILRYFLKAHFDKGKIKLSELITLIVYGLLFGFVFSLLRMILARCVKPKVSAVLLLLLFPGSGLSFHFLYPFSKFILENISVQFKKISFKWIVPVLMLISQYRFNLIEYVMYPVYKIIGGCMTILIITMPFLPSVSEWVLQMMQGMMSLKLISLFELVGSISIVTLVLLLYAIFKSYRKVAQVLACWSIVVMIIPLSSKIIYLDVGQGDATLIKTALNQHVILIDTGKRNQYNKLKLKLHKYGIKRIDQLVITHADEDHDGSVDLIQKDFNVKSVIREYEDLNVLTSFPIDVESDDTNENSLLMGLKIKDKQFLFTGDAGIKQELALLRKYPSIKADILKLGHHGSKTSSSKELIKHLQSTYGIASSNPKIYGHPHIEVKKNLQRQHTRLLQTSIEGDIIVTFTILFDFIHTQAKGFAIM